MIPDPAHDDPRHLSEVLTGRVLPLVSRPARSVGGELGARRDPWSVDRVNVLLAFPDVYEVGMSHLGVRLLYQLVNDRAGAFCDLAFAPWPDLEEQLRRFRLPLFGLESRRPARAFDLVGFSLGYELGFTNVLTMLDLAGLPLRAAERGEDDPLVVAGGAATLNPVVMGPFCDLLLLGDGEESLLELVDALEAARRERAPRAERLRRARALPGAWYPGVDRPVRPRFVADLSAPPPPELVPVIEPVHDRVTVEVMRGCARGCRFCQAGMVHRPVRERDPGAVVAAAHAEVLRSGQPEVSVQALSASDYTGLAATVTGLGAALAGTRTNLVLPSLRAGALEAGLAEQIGRERPGGFTLAPEAGTQRLRDVINKQLTEEQIVASVEHAFAAGAQRVKLYFMIGLPTETDADLDGIVALVSWAVGTSPLGAKQVNVSISPFAPKPHTPFQWAGQIARDEIARRNRYLDQRLSRLRVKAALRDPDVSFLEAVLGLGHGAVADVVEDAWRRGARFDAWTEVFRMSRWEEAFAAAGVDPLEIVAPRAVAEPLPWDGVAGPVSREFLAADWERARRGRTLPDCRLSRTCFHCGACPEGQEHVFAQATGAAAGTEGSASPAAAAEPVAVAAPDSAAAVATIDASTTGGAGTPPDTDDPRWRSWRSQAADRCWHRVAYAKEGDLIFLGHLDFQRQLQLALRRSGLPLAYSKGYHPHPLMKFGAPLPVGVAGAQETFDVALEWARSDAGAFLDAALPPGLRVRGVVVVGAQSPPSIDRFVERCSYRVALPPVSAGGPTSEQLRGRRDAFLASARWLHVRERPRGDLEIDVRPLVPEGGLTLDEDDGEEGRPWLSCTLLRDERAAHLPIYDFLASLLGPTLAEPRWCRCERTVCQGRDEAGRWLTPLEDVAATGRRFWLRTRILG
ncbi:MAG: TIGR03936 family radical SAM-associated protein [Candidatus Krumholzibacteriia bacterium]